MRGGTPQPMFLNPASQSGHEAAAMSGGALAHGRFDASFRLRDADRVELVAPKMSPRTRRRASGIIGAAVAAALVIDTSGGPSPPPEVEARHQMTSGVSTDTDRAGGVERRPAVSAAAVVGGDAVAVFAASDANFIAQISPTPAPAAAAVARVLVAVGVGSPLLAPRAPAFVADARGSRANSNQTVGSSAAGPLLKEGDTSSARTGVSTVAPMQPQAVVHIAVTGMSDIVRVVRRSSFASHGRRSTLVEGSHASAEGLDEDTTENRSARGSETAVVAMEKPGDLFGVGTRRVRARARDPCVCVSGADGESAGAQTYLAAPPRISPWTLCFDSFVCKRRFVDSVLAEQARDVTAAVCTLSVITTLAFVTLHDQEVRVCLCV